MANLKKIKISCVIFTLLATIAKNVGINNKMFRFNTILFSEPKFIVVITLRFAFSAEFLRRCVLSGESQCRALPWC